jgi:hypothetical protein
MKSVLKAGDGMDFLGRWTAQGMHAEEQRPTLLVNKCQFCQKRKDAGELGFRGEPLTFVDAAKACICHDCVSLCVEILNNRGTDWRVPTND